ncbi:helix-turn-helix domain-containing protein [Pseudomonas stutzeri]|uniref:helix-turn-helix domain-containing protein n=1 Tax=Stutzerimonas stutzeri TaxID=316 RepID=UPI001E5EB335|nr:helix-turn-helix domain-containing protein [Stutzerimonas stutzeri]MCC8344984.1 helix-turn-helix domain-containing protein [Stutzerimonas stutzeri]
MTTFDTSTGAPDTPQTPGLKRAELNWFHVFKSMVDNELAKLGPDAFAVYCVIKSHCDLVTGVAFPSVATIAKKAGISERQVMRKIKSLETHGYISKSRTKGHNSYRLREKIPIKDGRGRHQAMASWDYQPSRLRDVLDELKAMLRSGLSTGPAIHIEQLQIIQGKNSLGMQISHKHLQELERSSPALYESLMSIHNTLLKRKELDD